MTERGMLFELFGRKTTRSSESTVFRVSEVWMGLGLVLLIFFHAPSCSPWGEASLVLVIESHTKITDINRLYVQ